MFCEKHPWRRVTFGKAASFRTILQFKKREKDPSFQPETLLKVTLLHVCFLRFLHCANGRKLRNASHLFRM